MTLCEFFRSQTFRGKDQILIFYSESIQSFCIVADSVLNIIMDIKYQLLLQWFASNVWFCFPWIMNQKKMWNFLVITVLHKNVLLISSELLRDPIKKSSFNKKCQNQILFSEAGYLKLLIKWIWTTECLQLNTT